MAHSAWHFLSALACAPFSLAAACGALLPDVAWLPNEALIRRSKRMPLEVIDSLPSSRLWLYRATHSCWTWAIVAAWQPAISVGAMLHLAMDWPTHDGRMRQQLLWPLPWKWPKAWVIPKFRRRETKRQRCVLLSGGLDSAVALRRAMLDDAEGLWALFADYGQPYLAAEQAAVDQLSKMSGVPVVRVQVDLQAEVQATAAACAVSVPQAKVGTFALRNLTLMRIAAERGAEVIYIGTRCPLPCWDKHGDSNAWALSKAARHLSIEVRTPCMMWPKWLVRLRAAQAWGSACIYSSEGYCYDSDQHHSQV